MPYRPWNQSQVWNNKVQPLGTINPEILRENLIALIALNGVVVAETKLYFDSLNKKPKATK